jgi:hypothetical protein
MRMLFGLGYYRDPCKNWRATQTQQDQPALTSQTSTQFTQLKLDQHAADYYSMSQKLAYEKETERLNSQLGENTLQIRDMSTQLEQANNTSTSPTEKLKAAQQQLAKTSK